MQLVIPLRRSAYYASLAGLAASVGGLALSGWAYVGIGVFGSLSALGTFHVLSRRRTLSRNYPILIQLRYFLESIGPEFRQYFIEADQDERPFAREQRALVYRRAKREEDNKPFGSLLDMYGEGYEWLNHAMVPGKASIDACRITVGADRRQPYSASVFNISALSFGSISPNAIRALNDGAARGGFYHDTGEGGVSRYHLEPGGDLVWEIGTGYFGCRNAEGGFDEARFAENATHKQVRMIEIKLSQGAKPARGGVLPGAKVNDEVAAVRGVPVGRTVESPARHSAFSTPLELMAFIERLRALAGDKPVGFKLAIGHPWDWFSIARAMQESGVTPDFIVVDGSEGGTGSAPLEFINRVGMPMRDGLRLVDDTLVGLGLRDRVRLAAAGKITSAFHIFRTLALGADWCNSARGFMFALGCIQAMSCHNDRCPSGVATQDRRRWRNLDPEDKAVRVANFHQQTVASLVHLLCAAGLNHPSDVGLRHLYRRLSATESRSFADLYPALEAGSLNAGIVDQEPFRSCWEQARPDRFACDS